MPLSNCNRDRLCFKIEEFKAGKGDHWTTTATNLKKLNNNIENYLETVLKLPVEKNYIDTQAIAKENNRIHMLRQVLYNVKVVRKSTWNNWE